MKINPTEKQKLIATAQKVYFGYLALDFFRTRALCTAEAGPCSLAAYCQTLLSAETITALVVRNVLIAGKYYQLQIKPSLHKASEYEVKLTRVLSQTDVALKFPNAYTDDQAMQVCLNRSFFVEILENKKSVVSLELTKGYRLGGVGKYQLYRTHLVTLCKIIDKINSEDNISHLLVALTTGAGKTFVQAVWLQVLHLAGFNAIFAMPDKLIDQFIKALRKLVPDEVVDAILQLRDNNQDSSPEVVNALAHLNVPGKLIVASSDCLLERHYEALSVAPASQTFLSFDEQHLLIEEERQWKRLLQVSSRLLSMYLTATPDRETYALSGCKPVAIMSSGQKQKEGQGQFPTIRTHHCQFMTDYNRAYKAEHYWDGLFNSLLLKYSDVIQPERSSAVRSILEELPYSLDSIPEESASRWRLQVPVARKILLMIDDNESLVNCFDFLQNPLNVSRGREQAPLRIYHGGNILKRDGVTEFFGLKNVDREILAWTHQQRKDKYFKGLSQADSDVLNPMLQELEKFGLSAQLKSNMFHYLVEYVLSDLTSMTLIEHNKWRKQSPAAFQKFVIEHFVYRDRRYYEAALKKEIDPQGAAHISVLLENISAYLRNAIQSNDQTVLALMTDNWFLDRTLYNKLWDACSRGYIKTLEYRNALQSYEQDYLVMSVMTGMTRAETPIAESKPFVALDEDRYRLYDNQGIRVDRAKKRRRTPIELLNDKTEESSFKPKYKDISETVSDAYFQLGFIGMYISNKKTEGYNDLNLHTVVNVAENKLSVNNSPSNLTQGIGRERGGDSTVKPAYFHASGRGQFAEFDLSLLENNDYYPEQLAAQERYNQQYVAFLGEQVGKDIVAWYYEHQNPDETIDPDRFKRQVLRYVASALRRLNIQSNHNIRLSRAQLAKVIAKAMDTLDDEIHHIKDPYRLSLFVRTLGSIFSFIANCYHLIISLKAVWQRYRQARQSPDDSPTSGTRADSLYQKILNQTSYHSLMSRTLVAAEFRVWMKRKAIALPYIIKQSAYDYLKPNIQHKLKDHFRRVLFPLFELSVTEDKKTLVREKLLAYEDRFAALLQRNEQVVALLLDETQAMNRTETILTFLQQVPGLEHLARVDVVESQDFAVAHAHWIQQFLSLLLNISPKLQDKVIPVLSHFLQNDFLNHLGAFVPHDNKEKIAQSLQNTANLEAFIQTYIHDNPTQVWDAPTIFASFKQTFGLQECDLLTTKVEQMQRAVEAFKQPLIAGQLDKVTHAIHQQLLPCLVNFYPLTVRQKLLEQIDPIQLRAWLSQEQQSIAAFMHQAKPEQIAAYMFEHLCKPPLPAQINAFQEGDRLARELQTQMNTQGYVSNGLSYFTNNVPPILKTPDFWAMISLLLPYHHYQEFKMLFEIKPKKAVTFAGRLIQCLKQKRKGAKPTPQEIIQIINDVFHKDYKDTQAYAEQIKKQIESLTDPAIIQLSPLQTQQFAVICRQYCLPLLAAFIENDEHKAAFLSKRHTDADLTKIFMTHSTTLEQLANPVITNKRALVLPIIQALHPNLVTLQALVDPVDYATTRQNQCKQILQDRLQPLFADVLAHDTSLLNHNKAIDLLLTHLTPIITHPQFKELLNVVMHSLTLDELTFLFETLKIDRPAATAKRLLQFKTLVNQQNLNEIKRVFIVSGDQAELDLDKLPLRQVLDDFGKLAEEMMRCHCYYNQMDMKGELDSTIKPALWSKMSEPLKKIRIPAPDTMMSRSARKIFFLQSVRNGLAMAGRVGADSNRHVVTLLHRVKNHILRPLGWRINISTLFSRVMATIKAIVSYCKQGVKWIVQCVQKSKPREQDVDAVEYEEAAVACARSINTLKPLTFEQVRERACPPDVISIVEEAIERRPSVVRLFDRPLSQTDPLADEADDVPTNGCYLC